MREWRAQGRIRNISGRRHPLMFSKYGLSGMITFILILTYVHCNLVFRIVLYLAKVKRIGHPQIFPVLTILIQFVWSTVTAGSVLQTAKSFIELRGSHEVRQQAFIRQTQARGSGYNLTRFGSPEPGLVWRADFERSTRSRCYARHYDVGMVYDKGNMEKCLLETNEYQWLWYSLYKM